MMRRLLHSAAVAALALAPTFAFAHPDIVPHDQTGFLTGLLHPLTVAAPLAAMRAVGLWAAMLGGRAIWALPLSFAALLIMGAAAGAAGIAVPAAIEPMIVASVVMLGLAVAFGV